MGCIRGNSGIHDRIISPLDFASNNVFYGTPEEEFELHMIGLTSILPRNLDSTVQVSLKEDDGVRMVTSRGLVFLSKQGGQHVLELGDVSCIAEVMSHIVPLLMKEKESFNEVTLAWIQVSFTYHSGGVFVGGPIRTQQDLKLVITSPGLRVHNTAMSHLCTQFP